ncbi:MAG: sulfur carrier protein ThiS [Methyloceanibacter sp.]|nr:sulfur carrier protein ThiS [Methyloceanibacter sp.]
MQILINGEPVATKARNLDELCGELGFAGARFATAVNGSFVAAGRRTSTELSPEDEIEIVSPRQGG